MSRRPRVAVLGGGFLGLNVARELLGHGYEVTVLEAGTRPGGVSVSRELGGRTVDRFYHTILPTDSALLRLVDELGLGPKLAWRRTKSGFFQDGRIHSVSTPLELLRFPVLSFPERVRLGLAVFRAQRLRDWRSIEGETCESWLTRICGRSIYEKMWAPLLRAKLGDAAPRVSATFIWATIHRLQAGTRDDSGLAKDLSPGMMGYLRGGYQGLIDALVADVERRGGVVRTNATITSLDSEATLGTDAFPGARGAQRPDSVTHDGGPPQRGAAGPWRIEIVGSTNASLEFDVVVSTLPPKVLARLAQGGTLRGLGGDVEGLGVVCEILLLDRPLTEFYILNLGDPALPFTGIIESTHLAPDGEFGGASVVYLPRYLAPGDVWAEFGDDEVSLRFRQSLRTVFPEFDDAWILESAVERAPFVQPIHTTDYRERMPETCPAPGLWVASSAQVHPWPVHNDQILRRAQLVAGEIVASQAS
ncbi:MAG: FAD-dependent oxidoreductase [Candidatus Eisenbacteria bacterium]|uniref:FAD-dependent oxidoreductase n=1 Tax=Eiseniibacteriota bacterium TaxID=2212470 RepID=A0A956NJ92_UNCEI|nr:FAD-dependent oxidoreductase [Candidatus Eisenbacteria bacterium]